MPPKKKSSTPAKKPSVKSATKKPTTVQKAKEKSSKTPSTRRKSTAPGKHKRKNLPPEEMFPFKTFPFRLEYKDGDDIRICHFECEEHRTKYIERYKFPKGSYYLDTANP